jgi:hypothetical protein
MLKKLIMAIRLSSAVWLSFVEQLLHVEKPTPAGNSR